MSFLPWLLLGILAVVVVWVVMKQNSPLPPPQATTPWGQPQPITGGAQYPQAQNSDAALGTSIANAVSAAFGLATTIVQTSNKPK